MRYFVYLLFLLISITNYAQNEHSYHLGLGVEYNQPISNITNLKSRFGPAFKLKIANKYFLKNVSGKRTNLSFDLLYEKHIAGKGFTFNNFTNIKYQNYHGIALTIGGQFELTKPNRKVNPWLGGHYGFGFFWFESVYQQAGLSATATNVIGGDFLRLQPEFGIRVQHGENMMSEYFVGLGNRLAIFGSIEEYNPDDNFLIFDFALSFGANFYFKILD